MDGESLSEIEAALDSALDAAGLLKPIAAGDHVVIAVGSRGIPNYFRIIKKLVKRINDRGAKAVLLPAMGSHGGGDADGQVKILAEFGLTSDRVGADVINTMEVAELGQSRSGIKAYADRTLLGCDHILIVNRIKEHTEFSGEIESGLLKMMAVGFGRTPGAIEMHRCAVKTGYELAIKELAQVYLEKLPILGGIGILDSPSGGTSRLEAIPAAEFFSLEARLLQEAHRITPKLPLDQIDILIVDEIGKDISGTGMDTKVIGRVMNVYEAEPDLPKITRILVRDLTQATHGNALGIGLADFTTRKLVQKIDSGVTNINCITAVTPEKARIPMTFETEREALEAAFRTIGPINEDDVRLLWIKNTSSLTDFWASPAAVAAMTPAGIEVSSGSYRLGFNPGGGLLAPIPV
jgi:hypothetical protein